jgi:hypothetical protein
MPDDDRRREASRAAARLQHDLGRYIRFWAPEEMEPDTEALRARLIRDVLATRSGPEGVVPAAAVFEEWLAEEGARFAGAEDAAALERLRSSVEKLRALAARLPMLARPELLELDRLTRSIAEDCRGLVRTVRGASR